MRSLRDFTGETPLPLFQTMTLRSLLLVLALPEVYPRIVTPSYSRADGGNHMKLTGIFFAFLAVLLISPAVLAQEKGVDTQSQKVRDSGSNRNAGVNGGKTDVGTSGSGINFGKGKTPATIVLPNPYRFTARRDELLTAISELMRDRKLIVDDAASRPSEGIIVSQPYTFIKGAVVAEPELSRYADVQTSLTRGWTRGRYTMTVEVQPIDGTSANVSINAKIEGRTDGATGAEWMTLPSNGTAEQEFLTALIEHLGGTPKTGRRSLELLPNVNLAALKPDGIKFQVSWIY